MGLRLSIVTPARPLVETEVDGLVAPGREGEFGVLPGHERFLAPLSAGLLRYRAGGEEIRVAVAGGFAEVCEDRVTILASSAALPADVDAAQTREELARAEAALAELGSLSPPDELDQARERVAAAQARLALTG